jgi:hypothetical protein
MDRLHDWMIAQRDLVPEGSAISRALDYSLKRWAALSHYLNDGAVPIDNNWGRESDPTMGSWPQKLALRRIATQRKTGGGDHELDPVGAAQRA